MNAASAKKAMYSSQRQCFESAQNLVKCCHSENCMANPASDVTQDDVISEWTKWPGVHEAVEETEATSGYNSQIKRLSLPPADVSDAELKAMVDYCSILSETAQISLEKSFDSARFRITNGL